MWFRSSVILRSFLGLLAAIFMLSLFFVAYRNDEWIGFGAIPFCFIPAVVIAARLAQRLDLEKRNAAWIGLPTILTMILVTIFSFFIFSAAGERILAHPLMAASLIAGLGAIVFSLYLASSRLLIRSTNEKNRG